MGLVDHVGLKTLTAGWSGTRRLDCI